jgi:hypothetical protein
MDRAGELLPNGSYELHRPFNVMNNDTCMFNNHMYCTEDGLADRGLSKADRS